MTQLTYDSLTLKYLEEESTALMAKHGKSFRFASLILPNRNIEMVSDLYKICRFIDDCADELDLKESEKALQNIKENLSSPVENSTFNAIFEKVEKNGVERLYLQELVNGATFDIQKKEITSEKDLITYCYRVAGVVGLMVCPLINVTDKKGYPHAIDLGIGMQLTNICRDILQDLKNGRIYLPKSWLNNNKMDQDKIEKFTPAKIKAITKSLLDLADKYYQSGYNGLSYIPFRPRLSILVAGEVYRHIGEKIRNNGYKISAKRVYLNKIEKIWVLLKTIPLLGTSFFWRTKPHDFNLHKHIRGLPGVKL